MEQQRKIDQDNVFLRKLCVLYLIHSMVFVLEGLSNVHDRVICMADDPVLCNNYPWGRLIYEEIIIEWARMFRQIRKGTYNFKLDKFSFPLQAWVLEFLLLPYSSILATKIGDGYPRIMRWHTLADADMREARQVIYDDEECHVGS